MLEILDYLKARYLSSEKAQGMTEYAIVLGMIVVIAVAVFGGSGTLRQNINLIFTNIGSKLQSIAQSIG